jgi:hypothetical protein
VNNVCDSIEKKNVFLTSCFLKYDYLIIKLVKILSGALTPDSVRGIILEPRITPQVSNRLRGVFFPMPLDGNELRLVCWAGRCNCYNVFIS